MKDLKIKQIAIGAGLLAIGVFLGGIIFNGPSGPVNHQDHAHETIVEVWTCSMHPQIRRADLGNAHFAGWT